MRPDMPHNGSTMKRPLYLILAVAALLLGGVVVWAAPLSSTSYALYTPSGFVDLLVTRGLIPEGLAPKARSLAALLTRNAPAAHPSQAPMNADKVKVSVSQLIEHGTLTYNRFEDIKGLLLLVQNTTNERITLEARRKCQVVYRVYDAEGALVYDGATSERCRTSTEQVTYDLEAGQTRMFQIVHAQSTHELPPGTYRFEIEYPGYGQGDLTVTVQ